MAKFSQSKELQNITQAALDAGVLMRLTNKKSRADWWIAFAKILKSRSATKNVTPPKGL